MGSITEIVYAPLVANDSSGHGASATIKFRRPEPRRSEIVFAHITLARYKLTGVTKAHDSPSGEFHTVSSKAKASIREYCYFESSSDMLRCVNVTNSPIDYSCLEISRFESVTFQLQVESGYAWANAVVMSYS